VLQELQHSHTRGHEADGDGCTLFAVQDFTSGALAVLTFVDLSRRILPDLST